MGTNTKLNFLGTTTHGSKILLAGEDGAKAPTVFTGRRGELRGLKFYKGRRQDSISCLREYRRGAFVSIVKVED